MAEAPARHDRTELTMSGGIDTTAAVALLSGFSLILTLATVRLCKRNAPKRPDTGVFDPHHVRVLRGDFASVHDTGDSL